MKRTFIKLLTVSLTLLVLVACTQNLQMTNEEDNNSQNLLGVASIPINANSSDNLVTQTPDAFINIKSGLDVKTGLSGTINGNGFIYLRQSLEITNNTGSDLKNLTLVAISTDANAVSATRNLKSISGAPLTQEEAFNSPESLKNIDVNNISALKALGINPKYLPRPIQARNSDGTVDAEHADLVFYEETELTSVIPAISALVGGSEGKKFKLFEYGFQAGDVPNSATQTVHIAFAIPKDSKFARFNFTAAFITDPESRVSQGPLEVTGNPDTGFNDAINRFNNANANSFAILGGNYRQLPDNISEANNNLACFADVLIGYSQANFQNPAYLTEGFDGLSAGKQGVCPRIDNVKICQSDFIINGVDIKGDIDKVKNCTDIIGDLRIYQTELKDLFFLNNLEKITGELCIGCNLFNEKSKESVNTALISLTGLENLTSVGGDLNISGNYKLTNLAGLKSLSSVGGRLEIGNNSLTSLMGLEKLSFVGGTFSISGNTLKSLKGLENLSFLKGDLQIWGNFGLTSLAGLENLSSIEGFLEIIGNKSLTSLEGLENLSSVGKWLEVSHNGSLMSLMGLNNLFSVGRLYIGVNEVLTSLVGLENLQEVRGGHKVIELNPQFDCTPYNKDKPAYFPLTESKGNKVDCAIQ